MQWFGDVGEQLLFHFSVLGGNLLLLHGVLLLNQSFDLKVFCCAKKGWELLLLHADLTQVHEVQDEKEMVVVHPSQIDHWVGVVEVSEHSQE